LKVALNTIHPLNPSTIVLRHVTPINNFVTSCHTHQQLCYVMPQHSLKRFIHQYLSLAKYTTIVLRRFDTEYFTWSSFVNSTLPCNMNVTLIYSSMKFFIQSLM
jgi:hypothetical protein